MTPFHWWGPLYTTQYILPLGNGYNVNSSLSPEVCIFINLLPHVWVCLSGTFRDTDLHVSRYQSFDGRRFDPFHLVEWNRCQAGGRRRWWQTIHHLSLPPVDLRYTTTCHYFYSSRRKAYCSWWIWKSQLAWQVSLGSLGSFCVPLVVCRTKKAEFSLYLTGIDD